MPLRHHQPPSDARMIGDISRRVAVLEREKNPVSGGGKAKLVATWAGPLPTALGNGLVWRVPFNSDGSTFTFTLTRAFARVESALTASISFRLEKSAGGDVPFSPTTITTITIPAGDYETENTGLTTTVTSGDLLRLVFTAVYLGNPNYHIELVGTE